MLTLDKLGDRVSNSDSNQACFISICHCETIHGFAVKAKQSLPLSISDDSSILINSRDCLIAEFTLSSAEGLITKQTVHAQIISPLYI